MKIKRFNESSEKTLIKSVFGKIIELNSETIDDYINHYSEELDNQKVRKSFLVAPYQQIVDELILIKKENNW